MKTRLTGPNRTFNKSALSTLRYLRRGYDKEAERFYLLEENTPFMRLRALLADGLIERAPAPNADLYRITAAGLTLLDAEG